MSNKSALVVVTYSPDQWCPLNIKCRGIINDKGYLVSVNRIDGGGCTVLWGKWSRETKFYILQDETA